MATQYRILNEAFRDQGPFSGREIDDLVKAGKIPADQDVQKVATGKIIKAKVALLSAEANDAPPAPPSATRAGIGGLLVVAALAGSAWLLSVSDEKHPVRGKHFIIPGLMLLIGAQFIIGYVSATAKSGAKPSGQDSTPG
jgi:hypothetical protein